MKISEISSWVAMLVQSKLDDGVARFGKELRKIAGRDLVFVEPADPRFADVALEYDADDEARLLFVDVAFKSPEPVSHPQLVKRFGPRAPLPPPLDDFSGESIGDYFSFHEGEHELCLSVYFTGVPDESVNVTRLSLRRVVPVAAFVPKEIN